MSQANPARRTFLRFMVAVAALHVAAITLYYVLGIEQATPQRQRMFGWTWIVLTAALVFGGLNRLRRARRAR